QLKFAMKENIQIDSSVFGPNSEKVVESSDIWARLEQMIRDAEFWTLKSNKIIELLMKSTNSNVNLAKHCYETLRDNHLYALVCGDPMPAVNPGDAKNCCQFFWGSIRAAIHDQFNRFAILDEKTRERLFEAATENDRVRVRNSFWSITEKQPN